MLSHPSPLEEGGKPAPMISSKFFFFFGLASVFCIAADRVPLGVESLLLSLVTFFRLEASKISLPSKLRIPSAAFSSQAGHVCSQRLLPKGCQRQEHQCYLPP